MSLILSLVKIGVGSKIAKEAINVASDKLSNVDTSAYIEAVQDKINVGKEKLASVDTSAYIDAVQDKIQSVTKVKCSNCGQLISQKAKFCPGCGTSFRKNISEDGNIEDTVTQYVYADKSTGPTKSGEYIKQQGHHTQSTEEKIDIKETPNEYATVKCPMCGSVEEYGIYECSFCGYEFEY